MAKVVKFCAACEEGFAEKFGFCPNCGGALTAYELNPLAAAEKSNVEAESVVEKKAFAPVINESPAVVERASEPAAQAFSADDDEDELLEINNEPEVKPAKAIPAVAAAPTVSSFTQDFKPAASKPAITSSLYQNDAQTGRMKYDDGTYHITFVEEKNASGRNLLLLGAFMLVTTFALGGLVYSLFEKNLLVGTLGGDDDILAYVGPIDPEPVEEEPAPKKNPDKGGGGGGGGREEETPTSKGRLAPQMRATPMLTPTKTIEQKDFELKYQATTVGDKTAKPTDEKYGDPTSKFNISSDGMGSGGGQGSGRGTGQGSGRGTGQGSGNGSGSGNGLGNGNGNGTGDGDNNDRDSGPPPPIKTVTEPFRIISRPKPPYTDAARQNQVTGVVRVRVTFLASGQVGSVSAVSGLPYGLTEQAIAAAKAIKFEPAKRNGVPVPTTKVIEYSFTIY